MTHERCHDRLVDHLYGELPRREAAEVEEHLAACQACRAERDRLAAVRAAMREWPPPAPPERGDAVILAAARQTAEEWRRDSFSGALRKFSGRLALGTGLAAAAAYAVLSWSPGRAPTELAPLPETELAPLPEVAVTAPVPAEQARPPPTVAQREKQSLRMDDSSLSPRVRRPAAPGAAPSPQPSPPAGERESKAAPSTSAEERESKAAPSGPAGERESQAAPSALAGEKAAKLATRAEGPRTPSPAPAGEGRGEGLDRALPLTLVARDTQQRHARGELADAQKRFEPCPSGEGDLRRLAWIDPEGHVLRLERERLGGVLVEEWFDEQGRLREAVIRGRSAGRAWLRSIAVAESGEESAPDAPPGAPALDAPLPALVRRDPAKVFFAPTGCDPTPRR